MLPLLLMRGGEVGRVEKKQGRVTFPEREPLTGLIMVSVLEAAEGREGSIMERQPHSLPVLVCV